MTIKEKFRRGNITLLTAAISVLLVGIIALVTDVGYVYYDHAKLQTATNAAWKAGYDKLAEIRKTKSRLTAEDETIIKNHMKEVMAANGFGNLTDEQLKIVLTSNQTNLKIDSKDEVDLFFMKIFDIQKADVAAARAGGVDASAIIPIAIPHGEVHDLSWKTYDFIKFEGDEGFATGTEYIIKLGEAEGNDPLGDEEYMIYIPTGLSGSQPDDNKTMLAYGAIYWALQIDERDKESLTPAYWLLSNNGGGFLMRANSKFEQRLKSGDYKGVYYEQARPDRIKELLGYVGANITVDQINDYLTGLTRGEYTNNLIIPLTWRPQIAIYSSQDATDPVEDILIAAKIPYGNYALPKTDSNPGGWDRNSNYNANYNTKIFDLEILNGELDKFDWIHLHHEDFTGQTVNDAAKYCNGAFPTACQKIKPGCIKNIAIGTQKSSTNYNTAINTLKNLACVNCREHMTYEVTTKQVRQGWYNVTYYYAKLTGWNINDSELNANCLTAITERCGTCGVFDINNLGNQTNFSGCKFYNYLHDHYGYTDDTPFPYVYQESDLNLNAFDLCTKWFSEATSYQKMKWDVAETIKQHILKGGFMYTQCFAAETIDLSLQQGAFYKTHNLQQSYDNCMIFQNFTYTQLPKKGSGNSPIGYSSIFINNNGNGTVQNNYKYNPLCQVSGRPNTGAGATCSFTDATVKNGIDKMSSLSSTAWQYVGGQLTNEQGEQKGQFALMGGHYAQNINAKRFVLNNILFGSTSDKETSIGTHLTGRTKYQYGCIDPDNDGNRSNSDYKNRLLYGYDQPINFADIISSDNGKYSTETTNGIDIITGKVPLASYTPNQIVIVPIVGVPESVQNYQSTVTRVGDQEVENGDYTIYDLKVGALNSGAEGYDNLDSNFTPSDVGMTDLKNSVQIIGFAKFRIMDPSEYTRSEVLGDPLVGQIRGEFLGYIVDPREVATLLAAYNSGSL